jgi:MoaA/NifB/PqqE/SkfB family radical SAM enzyme
MQIEETYQNAKRFAKSGAWSQAVDLYTQILKEDPSHYNTLRDMAHLHLKSQGAKDNPFLNALVAQYSDKADPHYLSGLLAQQQEKPEIAQTEWERAVTLEPSHISAYGGLLKQSLSLTSQRHSDTFLHTPPPQFTRLQIEITTWCNLHCAGCPRTIGIENKAWNNIHMPLERFEKTLDHTPPSQTLCLQGVGESTLHPDFTEMVRIAKKSGKYTYININSNALAKPITFYEKLKAEGVNSISVSVDSFTPEIAEACRSGTNTEKLKKRVSELMSLYDPNAFVITIVVSKRNLADLPNTLLALNAMGRVKVEIQTLIVYDAEKGSEGNLPYGLNAQEQETLADWLLSQKDYPNLQIHGTLLNREKSAYRCSRPFVSPFVTVEGYLTPCCTTYDPALLGHANIAEKSLKELWVQPVFQKWLSDYTKESHAICKDCCFFTG